MQRIVFFSVLIMFIQFNVVGQTQKDSRTQVFPSGNKIEHTGNNRSSSCSETSEGTIPLIDCADVGTSSYNTNSLTSTVNSSVLASDAASPNPSCWDGTEYAGNWSVYDLSSGGTSLMVEVESFFDGGFCDVFWLTFYQGPDCSSLTEVGCDAILEYAGGWFSSEIIIDGLDPSQKLWIFSSSDDVYNLEINLRGMVTPGNTNCIDGVGANSGCNVGADGDDSWSGPSLSDVMCAGTDCDIRLRLYDTDGDGWDDGASITVKFDDVSQGDFAVSSGLSFEEFVLSPNIGAEIKLEYNTGSPATYDLENQYEVLYNDNYIIASDYNLASYSFPEATFDSYCTHTWYSNENTVYYTFTATNETATLDIDNVICNDGTVGEAQFGVWKDCGDIGDYAVSSTFMGCAVGTGTLAIPDLEIGETYILAVDGQAGDICNWDFVTTGVQLPTELVNLKAKSFNGFNRISWSTETERNSDYFIIQKSTDGKEFVDIDRIESAGNSQSLLGYYFDDHDQQQTTVYYRLKQVDFDGAFEYHGPKSLTYAGESVLTIVPNPVQGLGKVNYPFKAKSNYTISIIDMSGRMVENYLFMSGGSNRTFEFNSEELESGLYFLRIADEKGNVDQINFVK